MSVTITSSIVGLDELIPRPADIEAEDKDVQQLIPWVYRNADFVDEGLVSRHPRGACEFRPFFDELMTYLYSLRARGFDKAPEAGDTGIQNTLRANETITLPKKSWKVSPQRERSASFIRSQGMMLRELMTVVYLNLEDLKDYRIHFSVWRHDLKYLIGGQRFAARSEGAVTIGPREQNIPMITFSGWYAGQTWSEFLADTLSVMLGHLARNIGVQNSSSGLRDREVFVIGFRGPCLHICRGVFTADLISRVHSRGCSENEAFELKFTQDSNLFFKKDWLRAMRALARLLRYLIQTYPKEYVVGCSA